MSTYGCVEFLLRLLTKSSPSPPDRDFVKQIRKSNVATYERYAAKCCAVGKPRQIAARGTGIF